MGSFLGRSVILLVGLFTLPTLFGDFWAYQLGLYFLYSIAALGIGICWGQAGFLPLGQAMFLGIGAYLSGFSLIHFHDSAWLFLLLPSAAIAPGLLAFFFGLLIFRGRVESGPYFALITLALSLLTFQVATSWVEVTGGFNGLGGIPGLPGIAGFKALYYVIATVLTISVCGVAWLVKSPIGVIWRGIAENEPRLTFFGYDTPLLKALAFGISGLLGGIAGVFYAPHQGLVTPNLAGFILSAELLIWTAVGGRKTLMGPVIGAILVGSLTAELRDVVPVWELMIAGLFICVVLFMPKGIAGWPEQLFRRIFSHSRQEEKVTLAARGILTAPKLELSGCSLSLGSVGILDNLSFQIDEPGIYCLIGPNGAGKTSTFNAITGAVYIQSGTIQLDGERMSGLLPNNVALRGLGRKFQVPSIFPNLTIAENLLVAVWGGRCSLKDLFSYKPLNWSSTIITDLREKFPFLNQDENSANELSHGEKQVLELAMSLLGEPRLLLLDEPCAGLSPEETEKVIETVHWVRSTFDTTIMVIEHDMALVKDIADQVIVMHQGQVLTIGSVQDVQKDIRVKEVYVGVSI
ncbi:MAG TPA: ATP-binding cassette domain-containing protein [Nitrospinaceae bacterium]|jgi:branched-chain amino acid transport system permease protein|nr:ATP-binding cassette domain-containing protein [Nitrospinaceae bacterium]|tara:strand:+ start:1931 stop:3661 length:1731 start_codon:yes stop_codon:yes gene_type:complete